MKLRVDQAIVDLGLAPSKTKAQDLIQAEAIEIFDGKSWQKVTKPSLAFDQTRHQIRVIENETLRYVSRGGLKLEGAIRDCEIDISQISLALDVGVSTGGFTDCLLSLGAARVIAVDVSKGEMAKKLADDGRVTFFGEINARDLSRAPALKKYIEKIDLVVIDVSFISLAKVLPEIYSFLKANGLLLALIKPQFEVGRANLDKHGVVKSQVAVEAALEDLQKSAESCGFKVRDVLKSRVKGKDGNQEYFIYATKSSASDSGNRSRRVRANTKV